MVMINQGLSLIVFDILKSCWQAFFLVLSDFHKILPKILC